MAGKYVQAPREWTQDVIHKMIQAIIHLKWYMPRRDRQDGFDTKYNGIRIDFYPNGIDFDVDRKGEYRSQVKWESIIVGDAQVPTVTNLTQMDEETRNGLGPVLRHYLDTTE